MPTNIERDANLMAEIHAKADWNRTEQNAKRLAEAEKWFTDKHHSSWQDWATVKATGKVR